MSARSAFRPKAACCCPPAVTADAACTQRIYDAATGKELTTYAKHDNIVLASAFSPNGSLVATGGGANHEIHIWDPKTGETKAVLKGTGQPRLGRGLLG